MAKKEENKQLVELSEKVTHLEDQLKRAVADYHNLEKRVVEGRSELTKWASGDLVMRILPTLDHLEQAVKGAGDAGEASAWLQGVILAVKEFKKVLEEEGLQVINVQVGDNFDPNIAEAIEVREGENGKVLEVAQIGYNLNGKIIRPAKVVVGKKGDSV